MWRNVYHHLNNIMFCTEKLVYSPAISYFSVRYICCFLQTRYFIFNTKFIQHGMNVDFCYVWWKVEVQISIVPTGSSHINEYFVDWSRGVPQSMSPTLTRWKKINYILPINNCRGTFWFLAILFNCYQSIFSKKSA